MSDEDAIAAAVTEMVDAINRSDFVTATAAFSDAPIIIEDIAPFCWHGPAPRKSERQWRRCHYPRSARAIECPLVGVIGPSG